VVFEGFDRKGQLRALFGGGRYDELLHTIAGGSSSSSSSSSGGGANCGGATATANDTNGDEGGKKKKKKKITKKKNISLPAVGFGFGDAVLVEMLRANVLLPDFSGKSVQVVVYAKDGDSAAHLQAVQTANNLRAAGVTVDLILDKEKRIKWVFSHADKIAAKAVVLINGQGEVKVKNMSTGHQDDIYGADTPQIREAVVAAVGQVLVSSADC